jgi:hypothetical protein
MKINRRSIAAGLAAGVLAGGTVDAIAATTSGARTSSRSSTTTSKTPGGWDRYRPGWRGDGTTWRTPASGADWGKSRGGWTNPVMSRRW